MTAPQRALQIWSVLVLAAMKQSILSYSKLSGLTGLPAQSLGSLLGRVAWFCERKHFPPLTVIVVNGPTGRPGDEYPGSDDPLKILSDQNRVFVFDWVGKGAPKEQDFSLSYGTRK